MNGIYNIGGGECSDLMLSPNNGYEPFDFAQGKLRGTRPLRVIRRFVVRSSQTLRAIALQGTLARLDLPYSVRRAFIGSVEAARRAGRMLAMAAQIPRAMMELPSTNGS